MHSSQNQRKVQNMADSNIAIAIDFENIGNRDQIRSLLNEVSGVGRIIVKKAFADWNKESRDVQTELQQLGIELIHQMTSTSGKNSSDIRLAIETIDLMHTSPVDIEAYVIASSDADFYPLVAKLRSSGKTVIVAGRKTKTSDMLINGCDRYIDLDNLAAQSTELETLASSTPRSRERANDGLDKSNQPLSNPEGCETTPDSPCNEDGLVQHIPDDVRVLTVQAMSSSINPEGVVKGSPLHLTMRRIDPSFDYRTIGFSTFSSFLEHIPEVQIERPNGPGDITVRHATHH